MNFSLPNDDKDNAPQSAQTAAASSSSDSDSSKGKAGTYSLYVDEAQLEQGVVPVWATGLFECYDDIPNCLITAFAPCVTFGQIAEMVDRGHNSWGVYVLLHAGILCCTGCACLVSAYYRIKMSNLYKLPDDPIINLLVHLICEPCALCQEYRELQARGFNLQLGVGWHGQSPEIQQTGGFMVAPKGCHICSCKSLVVEIHGNVEVDLQHSKDITFRQPLILLFQPSFIFAGLLYRPLKLKAMYYSGPVQLKLMVQEGSGRPQLKAYKGLKYLMCCPTDVG
ncbi:plant cadmium resistance 2-like protein [Tanacetum coccineum]|uniref:Plant cadmium resistance 2-like protein n=1 Tax=Tanacetum coccineum TaxID=301880 RepID=A0ABQ5ATG5_9ASTR